MAEVFLPYLTFSIYGTPGSLRYVMNAVPYGEVGFAAHLGDV